MKKSNALLAFLCLILSNVILVSLSAQNIGNPPAWNWVKKLGGSGSDQGNDVVRDAFDNVYVVGTFNGVFKIGNNQWQGAGLNDGFLAKFAPDGALLWARQLKPNSVDGETFCQHVLLDNAGNVVVGGQFKSGNLLIENSTLTLAGATDHFVAKFSPDGVLTWAKAFGSPASTESIRAMTADNSGNIYCLGGSKIFKYNVAGSIEWMVDNPSGNPNLSGDLVWNGGILYLAGSFNNTVQLGNTTLSTAESGLFLVEISVANGQLSNGLKIMESDSYYLDLNLNALLVNGPNEFYLAGQFRDSLRTTTCQTVGVNFIGQKSFIAKLGTADCFWISTESSITSSRNTIIDITLDSDGNLWAVGERDANDVFFDNLQLGGKSIGFILKLNAADGTAQYLAENAPNKGIVAAGQNVYTTGAKKFDGVLNKISASGTNLFEKVFDGDGAYCVINALESDGTGAYFSATLNGKITLAGVTLESQSTSLLVGKMSLDGNQLLWYKIIEGAIGVYRVEGARSGFLDRSQGKFYCLASFSGPISYNGQNYTPLDPENADFFVLQTSTDGSAGWLKVFPGLQYLNNITVDKTGNPIVCGGFSDAITLGNTTMNSKGDVDFIVAKMDGSGNILWAKRGGGEDTEYAAMTSTDAQNNIYLAAECPSLQLDFNDQWSLSSNDGDGNLLFLKLTPDGDPVWEKLYGSTAALSNEFRCFPYSLLTDEAGYSFMTGFYGKNNNFGNISLNSPYSFNNFIGKFDPSGDPVWINPIKTKRTAINYHETDLDELGNIYVAGQIQDSVFIEGNVLVRQGSVSANNFYFARFDGADGSLDWLKAMSGSPDAIGFPTSIAVHDHESILCGGTVIDRVQFDNISLNTASGVSGFLGLLGKNITVAVHTPEQGNKLLEISPNPASTYTTLTTKTGIAEPVEIRIVDAKSMVVFQQELPSLTAKQALDISQLPAGVYFLQLRYGNNLETTRLVIL